MYGGKCCACFLPGIFVLKVFASNLVLINFLIINITEKMLIDFNTLLWNFILVDY